MTFLMPSNTQVKNAIAIFITNIIGDKLCIASEKYQRVCETIYADFWDGKNGILSFKDSEDITSAFLAEAICH